jgi:hypothetical protein
LARGRLASGIEGVSLESPPRWLEALLLRTLSPRDRETISGDLLEEYREARRPLLGPVRANIWYARQLISLLAARSFGGRGIRGFLAWVSVATALSGAWLLVMENLLRHAGYAGSSAVAVYIIVQSLATVLFLVGQSRPLFRLMLQAGALGLVLLGGAAIIRILSTSHFEGFVLLIGTALVLQGILALVVSSRKRRATII